MEHLSTHAHGQNAPGGISNLKMARVRHRPPYVWCALLALLGTLAGCASPTMSDRATRMQRAYVYYLDGAGGGKALSNWGGGVRQGLLAAGYDGAGEMFSWETGLGVMADQVASVKYKRDQAQELAQHMTQYTNEHPGAPVYIVGLSAGTAIATFALEALPDTASVENVVMLSGSLSADYDATQALRRVRNKMYVFTSQRDQVLQFLEPMFGSADRQQGEDGVIGVRGLLMPPHASAETRRQYAKIVTIPWREEFAAAGEYGGHTDAVKAPFVEKYVAPLVMAAHQRPAAVAAADTIENPDYARWVRFGVGSSATFEGTQLLDGVHQPVRLTVTLVSKHADSLLVERKFAAPGQAAQRVRQFFVHARIKPTGHPLTHPQSSVRELPPEELQLGSQKLLCAVKTINAPADFPEWGSNVNARVCGNDRIPGGLAAYELNATLNGAPFECSGRITDYRVVSP